jgi:hypothetical protein
MLSRNTTQRLLLSTPFRNFSIATPIQRLKFVEHPRYGKVYPFVTLNHDNHFPKTAMGSTVFMTMLNASIIYSTFIIPIYTAAFSAIFANPIFLLPSLTGNFLLWRRSSIYFYGDRSEVVNMYLKASGKQVIIETRDGESKTVNNTDIYGATVIGTKYESRIDFHHGANNFKYIRGNSISYDSWVLTNVLDKNFIDTRNTDYDFDVTKEFTWEFRDLVEIKKRKRVVDRIIVPTATAFTRLISHDKRRQAIKSGSLVTSL